MFQFLALFLLEQFNTFVWKIIIFFWKQQLYCIKKFKGKAKLFLKQSWVSIIVIIKRIKILKTNWLLLFCTKNDLLNLIMMQVKLILIPLSIINVVRFIPRKVIHIRGGSSGLQFPLEAVLNLIWSSFWSNGLHIKQVNCSYYLIF